MNINQEVKHTSLLDSVLFHQRELLNRIDTEKVNNCVQKTKERIQLFENDLLNDFQKQWLHHEKMAYLQISLSLTKTYSNNLAKFDSLEIKLQGILSQLDALKNRNADSFEK